jgi:hypothetical protein
VKKLKGKGSMKKIRWFKMFCIIKFPWAKFVVDEQGKVHQVRCKVYTKIEGKQTWLALKSNK